MTQKNDIHARQRWGAAYDRIPKSVFATLAFEAIADLEGYIDTTDVLDRAAEELQQMAGRAMPARQAAAARKLVETQRANLRHALAARGMLATVPA